MKQPWTKFDREAYMIAFGVVMREQRGLTVNRERLADACGISYAAIADYERARSLPNVYVMRRIADSLGLTPASFITMVEARYERGKLP